MFAEYGLGKGGVESTVQFDFESSFRPLAGYGLGKSPAFAQDASGLTIQVSVPLRGMG